MSVMNLVGRKTRTIAQEEEFYNEKFANWIFSAIGEKS
jgi:hypothetical protein